MLDSTECRVRSTINVGPWRVSANDVIHKVRKTDGQRFRTLSTETLCEYTYVRLSERLRIDT